MKPAIVRYYLLLVAISSVIFLAISTIQIHTQVVAIRQRVQEDIIYRDNAWDTTAYNADPLLPGTAPIYVLSSDGYVIERWKPVSGFLDAADFKHLISFSDPQTIHTLTNQTWRVLSLPVKKSEAVVGVIAVSYVEPTNQNIAELDSELRRIAEKISAQVKIENQGFSINQFDTRTLPHYVSFQVVDVFNRIVLKSNNSNSIDRLPNFIDPSYVANQLNGNTIQLIKDEQTHELFLVSTEPLLREDGSIGGVITVGKTVTPMVQGVVMYALVMLILGFALMALKRVWPIINRVMLSQKNGVKLAFDKTNSQLIVGDAKIPLTYASYQYYVCEAVFSKTHKRWEIDELLEKFGEEHSANAWRKVYDAMNLVNKKTMPLLHTKLIILEGKTYRLNPELKANTTTNHT